MEEDDSATLALALVLIAIAGSVDAIGFLKLGHLFLSFVSGDSTQLSVAASHGDWSTAAAPGMIVGTFVAGVIVGHLLSAAAGHWSRSAVLLTEAVLLAVALPLSGHPRALTVPIALAMGIQNAAISRSGHVHTALTYVTGTLVRLGAKVAAALTGRTAVPWEWVPYLLLWLSLTVGAIAGAVAYRALGLNSLLLPVSAVLTIAAIEAVVVYRRPRPL